MGRGQRPVVRRSDPPDLRHAGGLQPRAAGVHHAHPAEQRLPEPAAALLRALLFDSASAPDADSDGLPDQLAGAAASGNRLSLAGGASLKLFSYYAGDYVLTLSGCSDPAALAGVTLDGAPLALAAEGDTLTAVFSLPEGGGEHTLAFSASGALEAGRITVTAQ